MRLFSHCLQDISKIRLIEMVHIVAMYLSGGKDESFICKHFQCFCDCEHKEIEPKYPEKEKHKGKIKTFFTHKHKNKTLHVGVGCG